MADSREGTTRTLSEFASFEMLERNGISGPRCRLVEAASAVSSIASEFDGPVAVKLCGDRIAHKTERGLVRLGVQGAEAIAEAARTLFEAATPADGDVGVLVTEMIAGNRELIAGAIVDDTFGPCVMLGIGGIFAEALGDVAFRLAPISEIDAVEMIDDLRNQSLLGELRGESAVDRVELARILRGLGDALVTNSDVVSIDLNPLIVTPDGRPVPVDALIEVGA